MRALLFALIGLIAAVVAGTAGVLVYQARQQATPPKGESGGTTQKAPPTKSEAKADEPDKPSDTVESLPDPPKASDQSKLTPLNKEKTLYLETPEKGEKRVLFAAEVCLREGVLEVLVCKKQTKEHEAILRADLDARLLHAALVAAGATPGKPVQFINPKTEEPEYKPASGQKIKVTVHYTRNGKAVSHPAQDWILDKSTKKPMTHEWVFAGSRFLKNPDRPQDPEYYTANNGEVICISNFVDSMLDLPVEVSRDEKDLHFEAFTRRIPAVGSKVWVVMEPVPEEKKK